MSEMRTHMKNVASLLVSGAMARLLALLATIYVFKRVSLSENDTFLLSLSIGYIVGVLSELGIRGYLVRELAKVHAEPASAQAIFAQVMGARWVFLLVGLPLTAIALALAGYNNAVLWSSAGFILYAILDSYAMLFKFALRAYDRMEFDAVFSVIGRLAVLVLLLICGFMHHLTLLSIVMSYIAGALLECSMLVVFLQRVTPLRILGRTSWEAVKHTMRVSFPFAVVNMIGVLYLRTGTLILSKLAGEGGVAYFNVAARLPEALGFLPIAIVNAFIPHLSRRATDIPLIRRYSGFLVRYLGFAGVFVTVLFAVETRFIILLVSKPAYLVAAPVFRWYGFWLLLSFLQYAMMNILICINEEKLVMWRYAMAFVLNIVLNLILISRWGVTGAAIALTLSELFSLVFNWTILARRQIHVPVSAFVEIALLGGLTAGMLRVCQPLPPLVRIALAGVVAGCAVLVFAWRTDRELLMRVLRRR